MFRLSVRQFFSRFHRKSASKGKRNFLSRRFRRPFLEQLEDRLAPGSLWVRSTLYGDGWFQHDDSPFVDTPEMIAALTRSRLFDRTGAEQLAITSASGQLSRLSQQSASSPSQGAGQSQI